MKKASLFLSALLAAALLFAGCTTPVPAAAPTVAPTATPTVAPTAAPTETPAATAAPTQAAATPADGSDMNVSALLAQMGGTNAEAIKAWPAGLPKEVPEFKYGTLAPEVSFKMDIKGITAYAVSYTGVTKDNIDAYSKALKENGFTVTSQDASGMTIYSAVYPEKDGSMTMIVMMPIQSYFMVEIMPNVKG